MPIRTVLGSLLALLSLAPASVGAQAPQEAAALATIRSFLDALEQLDPVAFGEVFSEDASLFYPQAGHIDRVDGREEILRTVRIEFDAARNRLHAAGVTAPPYLGIEPVRFRVQVLGPDLAVVTWQVDRGTHGGRRTAVVRLEGGTGRIVHLHSSNQAVPAGAPAPPAGDRGER